MLASSKQWLEARVMALLARRGIPQNKLKAQTRKVGQGFMLISILFVLPCAVWTDTLSPLVKIVLQMGFAACMFLGVLLGFDEEKPPSR